MSNWDIKKTGPEKEDWLVCDDCGTRIGPKTQHLINASEGMYWDFCFKCGKKKMLNEITEMQNLVKTVEGIKQKGK